MLKKWFCILLALGFSFTNAASDDDEYDDDDDYDDEEEILPATKKLNTSPKAKKADAGDSRIGLSAGFDGSPLIGLVYNTGSGIEIGLGAGLSRSQWNQSLEKGNDEVSEEAVSEQEWKLVLDFGYALGKGLLDYGIGAQGIFETNKSGEMDKGVFPYFCVSGELFKNLSLSLKAGLFVNMLGVERKGQVKDEDGTTRDTNNTGFIDITVQSAVGLTFYFM